MSYRMLFFHQDCCENKHATHTHRPMHHGRVRARDVEMHKEEGFDTFQPTTTDKIEKIYTEQVVKR